MATRKPKHKRRSSQGTPLSRRLLRLREETGLTQTELARKGRLSSQQISDWERGAKKPSEPSLRRLAVLFGVDFVWLAFDLGDRDGTALRSA